MSISHFIKLIIISVLTTTCVQVFGQNKLLERNFWKLAPNLSDVKTLVAEGNSPTELNSYSFDPLALALIEHASNDILEYFLEFDNNDVNKLTHDGRTYIFWAAYGNNKTFMETLLEFGARTNIIDEHGYSLLNFTAVTGNKQKDIYDLIIENGANPSEEVNRDGANALLLLLPFLDTNEFVDYFQNNGLKITDKDKYGATALLYAAKGGNTKLIEWLVSEGLNLNITDDKGQNAAHYAAKGLRKKDQKLEIFEYLNKCSIPLDLLSLTGQTPLTIYAKGRTDFKIIEYLIAAGNDPFLIPELGRSAFMSMAGSIDFIGLEKINLDVKSINLFNNKGETALLIASKYANAQSFNFLIDNGADIFAQDKNDKNIVAYLFEGYRQSMHDNFMLKFEILQSKGIDFSAILPDGNTLFHKAVVLNKRPLINLLSNYNDNINHVNRDGLTALHIAVMKGKNTEIITALIDQGASVSIKTVFGESTLDLAVENEQLSLYMDKLTPVLGK